MEETVATGSHVVGHHGASAWQSIPIHGCRARDGVAHAPPAPPPAAARDAPAPGHLRTPAILVVEDDPDIRAIIAELLRDDGYRVIVAASHAAALVILAAIRFRLVLADTGAQGSDDPRRWEKLERLRAAAQPAPVVICTAHRAEAFDGFSELGFAALLPKPFDDLELLAAVHRLADAAPAG